MPRKIGKNEEKRLGKERNIWIATVRPDQRPHLVPVWFVWTSKRFFVCIEPKSVKGRNLRENEHVSLALEEGSKPIICEGCARVVRKPWPHPVIQAFTEKYGWKISEDTRYTRLIEVTPQKFLIW